jgi:hypothetical protein
MDPLGMEQRLQAVEPELNFQSDQSQITELTL